MNAPPEKKDLPITEFLPQDKARVEELINRIAQFSQEEKDCALELADEYLEAGKASGYDFLAAREDSGNIIGYICFGKIPLTASSFDIYWMAVDPSFQDKGTGSILLSAAEKEMLKQGAVTVFAETSSQPQYLSARNFYQKTGFRLVSYIEDFYKTGDGKLTYAKTIQGAPAKQKQNGTSAKQKGED